MESIRRFFVGCGFVLGALSAFFFLAGLSAQWGGAPPFDILGVLPLLGNIGYLFAYFWASVFAAGAVGCWLRAAFMSP